MAGAIGKLPDGLRPPPRLRRGEILSASADAAPRLLPQKEGDHPRQRMVEDIRSHRNSTLPSKRLILSQPIGKAVYSISD